MGAILKGLGSVLIALGIIAIVGTGVILYYNNVAKNEEELVQNDPNAAQNPGDPAQAGTLTQNGTPDATQIPAATDASATVNADPATTSLAPAVYSQPVTTMNTGCSHEYREEVVLPASCASQGVKKRVCKYCGDTITETIPALNHTPGEPVTVKKPTTTEKGLVQITCTVCGKLINSIELDMIEDPTKNNTTTEATHKHNYTAEVTKKATCTAEGEKTYTCQGCGNSFTTKIAATNHPSRSTVITEGDCKNPGKIETKCRECNAVVSSSDLTYEHKWGSWETTTTPTESSEGVQTKTCSVCGQTETRTIAKLPAGSGAGSGSGSSEGGGTSECAHSWTEERIEPTCVDEGYINYTCTKCGTTKSTTLDPTGRHKYSDYWDVDEPATPEEEGYRMKKCLVCGKKYEQTIPKLSLGCNHNVNDYKTDPSQTVKATTTSSGYYVKVCQKCGASYRVYIPKLGS